MSKWIYIQSVRLHSLSWHNVKDKVAILNLCNLNACAIFCRYNLILICHDRRWNTWIDIYRGLRWVIRCWIWIWSWLWVRVGSWIWVRLWIWLWIWILRLLLLIIIVYRGILST